MSPAERSPAKSSRPDLTYRDDGLFVSFFPNTPDGERAWKIMNATPGAEGGRVLKIHAESTFVQLRMAGYTARKDKSVPVTHEEINSLLQELTENDASNSYGSEGAGA